MKRLYALVLMILSLASGAHAQVEDSLTGTCWAEKGFRKVCQISFVGGEAFGFCQSHPFLKSSTVRFFSKLSSLPGDSRTFENDQIKVVIDEKLVFPVEESVNSWVRGKYFDKLSDLNVDLLCILGKS